jgi:hypothetical protein
VDVQASRISRPRNPPRRAWRDAPLSAPKGRSPPDTGFSPHRPAGPTVRAEPAVRTASSTPRTPHVAHSVGVGAVWAMGSRGGGRAGDGGHEARVHLAFESANAVPDRQAFVPDRMLQVPDLTPAVPDPSPRVPDFPAAVPDKASPVPEGRWGRTRQGPADPAWLAGRWTAAPNTPGGALTRPARLSSTAPLCADTFFFSPR